MGVYNCDSPVPETHFVSPVDRCLNSAHSEKRMQARAASWLAVTRVIQFFAHFCVTSSLVHGIGSHRYSL